MTEQNALQAAVVKVNKIQTLIMEVNKLTGYYNAGELWNHERIRPLFENLNQLSTALAHAKRQGKVSRIYRLSGGHKYAYCARLPDVPDAPRDTKPSVSLTKQVVKAPIKLHLTISFNTPGEAFEFLTTHKFLAEGVEFQVEK